jgi:hypothetical protein
MEDLIPNARVVAKGIPTGLIGFQDSLISNARVAKM